MLRPWELQIEINVRENKAIYLQIADSIIAAIKSGKLKAGDPLPGSRQLAAQLQLNRNTIVRALDILFAEGWLAAKERKGAFVAEHLPLQSKKSPGKQNDPEEKPEKEPRIVFDDGLPDSRLAPMNDLARAYRQLFSRKSRWQLMGYSHELGDFAFRKAIVQMLNYKRGMSTSVDEICITRGSQMAMYLAAHCLITKGDHVIVENPGYRPAWQALESAGAILLPLEVDQEGIKITELTQYLHQYPKIKAIYITPHHQFPTTVSLTLKRRLALVELSNRFGFTIIEDDYDHEFHFSQRPILPIASLGNVENYIYIGTMSKIVAPALRTGYLVATKSFIKQVGALRKIIDVQGDNIMEQALLQLINEGEIKKHLKRTSIQYKAKRDFFEQLIHQYLTGLVTFDKPDGGLAFWLVPLHKVDLNELTAQLANKGIQILPPCNFSFAECINGIRLGYASLSEQQLEEGVKTIAQLLIAQSDPNHTDHPPH